MPIYLSGNAATPSPMTKAVAAGGRRAVDHVVVDSCIRGRGSQVAPQFSAARWSLCSPSDTRRVSPPDWLSKRTVV